MPHPTMATRTSSTIIAGILVACTGLVFAQSREDIDQALRDFAAGKPLPNMPDLKKPVFLAEGVKPTPAVDRNVSGRYRQIP